MSTLKWGLLALAAVVLVGGGIWWWLDVTEPTVAQLNQTVLDAQEYQRLGTKPVAGDHEPFHPDGRFFVAIIGIILLAWVGFALINQWRVRRRPVVGSHTRPLPVINLATLPPKYTRKIGHHHR